MMPTKDTAIAYKGLLRGEHAFRGLKNGVNVRPVFHRLDKRIRAHVTLCMLAYFLERVVENETKVTFEQVRKVMRRVRAVQITFDKQTVWETSGLGSDAKPVFAARKIPPPPRVLPNEIS